MKFFIGGGFFGNWGGPHAISDPVAAKKRVRAIEEFTRLYTFCVTSQMRTYKKPAPTIEESSK